MIYFFKFPLIATLGGAEQHTLQLARHFVSTGHEIKLVTSDQHLFRLFEKHRLERKRMFVGWEPTSKWSLLLWPATFLIAWIKLKKIIQHSPPDSIFFCQSLTEKLVLHALNVIWIEHKIPGRWLKLNPLKFFYIKKSSQVKIITVSNFAAKEFIKLGVVKKNISVIYPGINPVDISRQDSGFTIGVLSRLDSEKGVMSFLRVINPVLQNHPSWRVVVAGQGAEQGLVEKLAQENPKIHYLGFVYNLDDFFSQISVLVYPSQVAESFGIGVLEALARGIPVVANNIGAIPEITSDFLVNNPKEWIETLGSLQNPSNYQIASEKSRAIAQKFSEIKMFAAFDDLLKTDK